MFCILFWTISFLGTMLTIVYLMKALDGLKHADRINELINKLIDIDPMRNGYYKDLRKYFLNAWYEWKFEFIETILLLLYFIFSINYLGSKYNIENKLQEIYNSKVNWHIHFIQYNILTVFRAYSSKACHACDCSFGGIFVT